MRLDITNPCGTMQSPINFGTAISGDRLLDRLIDFFNRRPQVVRGEASLVIAALRA